MSNKQIKMKPGKGQSGLGFAVGLLMCLIGLVIVIPSVGAFGILWTLVAAGITVFHGINTFTDKGIATHEIIIEEKEEEPERGGASFKKELNAASRLEEAKNLYETGLITAEEYEAKRKQILEEL